MGNLVSKLQERMKGAEPIIEEKEMFAQRLCDELVQAIQEMLNAEEEVASVAAVAKVGELAGELKFVCDDALATLRTAEMEESRIKLEGMRIAREKFARERKLRDLAARHERRAQLAAAEAEKHCAYADCRRPRAFFDEEGAGYCKRHAEEKGIRPKGKIQ